MAAARASTDFTYYATAYDVIVAAHRRGEGFGEVLTDAVVDFPSLQATPGLSLLCREEWVPFYESVGVDPFDPATGIPEGGTERLVRMTYRYDE